MSNTCTKETLNTFKECVANFVNVLRTNFNQHVQSSFDYRGNTLYYRIDNLDYNRDELDEIALIQFTNEIQQLGRSSGIFDIDVYVNIVKVRKINGELMVNSGSVDITFSADVVGDF